jgi:protocatechuate 3,4-dioxygenase beta subunit
MTHLNNNPDQDINISRRKTLGTLGAFGVLGATGLIGCGGGSSAKEPTAATSSSASTSAASVASSSSTASSTSGSCTVIPTETIGPYPLSTLLNSSSVLREVINEDKTGVPLTVKLKLVNANGLCTPVSGYVYIWHCDKDGNYSGYSTEVSKTYCRGVQYTDTNGVATFTTIYPGWYAGRITHIHFQIFLTAYSSTAKSTAISQMAFPLDITKAVYSSSLYTKGQNTSITSFSADNVFSDGTTYQMATISGNVTNGYTAELEVGLAI